MAEAGDPEITALLCAWNGGDQDALQELMDRVYRHLRGMAGQYLRSEHPDHTLQSAALVHEAYLRLIQLDQVSWQDRVHFYAICARLMRRILVDHAREHSAKKRGGDQQRVPLEEARNAARPQVPDFVALDQALRDLADRDAQQVRVVELRFFGGLNRDEIAEVLGISSATVTRRWRMARAWLYHHMVQGDTLGL